MSALIILTVSTIPLIYFYWCFCRKISILGTVGVEKNFDCLQKSFDTAINTTCKKQYNEYTIRQAKNEAELEKNQKAPTNQKPAIADEDCR